MNGFEQLLLDFKNLSQNKSQQGTFFELLMKKYFLTSPLYLEMFETVWLWSEFPYNGGNHDTGIDIVAKKRNCDEYCQKMSAPNLDDAKMNCALDLRSTVVYCEQILSKSSH